MPKYTFTFKKDDVFVEFFTADRDVVERQFQIWVADADDYVNNRPFKQTVGEQKVKREQGTEEAKTQEVKSKMQKAKSEAEIVQPSNPTENPITLQPSTSSTEQPEVFDKASSLLKTINSIQNTQGTINEEPTERASEYAPIDFDSVLEKTIENPTFEPNKNQDPIFLNLISSKNTTDKFHYLIITAYYLSEFEKLERFSIKQINTKLMQNLSEVIDHITLQAAINQNFIELVPDLTGVSEAGEYRLTRLGEEFFANKI